MALSASMALAAFCLASSLRLASFPSSSGTSSYTASMLFTAVTTASRQSSSFFCSTRSSSCAYSRSCLLELSSAWTVVNSFAVRSRARLRLSRSCLFLSSRSRSCMLASRKRTCSSRRASNAARALAADGWSSLSCGEQLLQLLIGEPREEEGGGVRSAGSSSAGAGASSLAFTKPRGTTGSQPSTGSWGQGASCTCHPGGNKSIL
mmetsp:Transcript_128181/g.304329  ORF Transcript_128181/g.304329 Transcript_128181/m.304329 type:complete len:206 (+) Transcript_128181:507-1124(+)